MKNYFLTCLGHVLCFAVLCSVAQSSLTLYDPMDHSLPGSSVHGDSPGKNTGVGCHALLLQGIFPTQGSNPGLPHCRQILYCLSYQGSPGIKLGSPALQANSLPAELPWKPHLRHTYVQIFLSYFLISAFCSECICVLINGFFSCLS